MDLCLEADYESPCEGAVEMNAIVELGGYKVGEAARLTPSPLQAHPLIKTVSACPGTMNNAG